MFVHLSEVKRQKSVPEDLRRSEEDRGSPIEVDICRPFEEEVRLLSPANLKKNVMEMSYSLLWRT